MPQQPFWIRVASPPNPSINAHAFCASSGKKARVRHESNTTNFWPVSLDDRLRPRWPDLRWKRLALENEGRLALGSRSNIRPRSPRKKGRDRRVLPIEPNRLARSRNNGSSLQKSRSKERPRPFCSSRSATPLSARTGRIRLLVPSLPFW